MAQGSVTGLFADIENDIQLDDLDVSAHRMVEVWSQLNQGQKNKFGQLINAILSLN
jgi:hypothetical protein